MKKYIYFEYILFRLLSQKAKANSAPSMSKLDALKLLFFVSCVKTTRPDEEDLLDIFDNFYAMQYGPVESDVYNYITNDKLEYYTFIDNYIVTKSDTSNINSKLNPEEIARLNFSIDALFEKNTKILTYNSFQLVDLTHKWASWKRAFEIAKMLGKGSEKMDVYLMRTDYQLFTL